MPRVAEADLAGAALAEIGRGAGWVKVIADFPDLAAGTDTQATYPTPAIAELVAAVHGAGARVAAHTTLAAAGQLVGVGVDSIEHGFRLDERAVHEMAGRGTAWTPTVTALEGLLAAPDLGPGRRRRLQEGRERVAELLPLAVRLGVPVLAGTDVTGSIPREVVLLAELGLEPSQALAAASSWPRGSWARRPPPRSSPTITTPARIPTSSPTQQPSSPTAPDCAEPRARDAAIWWSSTGSGSTGRLSGYPGGCVPSAGSCPLPPTRARRDRVRGCPGRYAAAARAGRRRRGCAPYRPASRRRTRCGP